MVIVSPLLSRCLAGRNNADCRILDLDMNHEKQALPRGESDYRVPFLAVLAGIDNPEQGVKKHRSCLVPAFVDAFFASHTKSTPERE
jgi:hypothetical protein